jgi:hypothetical protein
MQRSAAFSTTICHNNVQTFWLSWHASEIKISGRGRFSAGEFMPAYGWLMRGCPAADYGDFSSSPRGGP